MSDACSHVITFGPTWHVQPGTHVHILSGKPADVADLTCPDCGTKLFIYYRVLGAEHASEERESERSAK